MDLDRIEIVANKGILYKCFVKQKIVMECFSYNMDILDLQKGNKMVENTDCFIGQKIVKINNYYWVVSSTTNAIWKCDLSFNVIAYYIFEKECAMANLFRAVVCVKETIFLFPFNANYSYEFNTNTNAINKIDIDIGGNETQNEKFSYAFVVDDLIIAVGRNIGGFLKYDLQTRMATLVTKGWPFSNKYICSFTHCINGERAYTVSTQDASIVEFDLKNDKIVRYDLSKHCSNNLTTIMSRDEYIYITNDQCELLKLDNTLKVLDCRKIEGMDDKNIRLAGIDEKKCWYVGTESGKVLIESEEGTVNFSLDVDFDLRYGYCFTAVELYENKLLLQSRKTGEIICFDFDKKSKDKVYLSISDVLMDKYLFDMMKCVLDRGEVLVEGIGLRLVKYLEVI